MPFVTGIKSSRAVFLDLDVVALCDMEQVRFSRRQEDVKHCAEPSRLHRQLWSLFDEWDTEHWFGISPDAPDDPP